jgi:hypothetical protein
MGGSGIIVMVVVGILLIALYYGINALDILLVGPGLFAFLAVSVALIVLVVANRRRRNGFDGGTRSDPRKKRPSGSRR